MIGFLRGGPRPERDEDVTGLAQDDLGVSVLSYLLAGPILFGGLGWALSALTGWGWLVPVGVLGGMTLSIYVIWVRYGNQ